MHESGEEGKYSLSNKISHSLLKSISQPQCKFTSIFEEDSNSKSEEEKHRRESIKKRENAEYTWAHENL